MRTVKRRVAWGGLVALLAVSPGAVAEEIAPPGTQASVLLKALEFDRAAEGKSGDFVIAVVWTRSSKTSEGWALDMEKAFQGAKTFRQRPIRVSRVDLSQGDLMKSLGSAGVSVIYMPPGTESAAAEVCEAAKAASIATLGASRDLAKQCVAVTVVLEERKPKIIVNLPASKEQGLDLGANLLRLAEVLR